MAINLGEYDPDAKLAKINLGKFAPLPEDMEYEQFRTRWLKNQQRGIGEATWEWAKAVPEGFSEYFTEDVWNALNNKSMLRSMFGFGEEEGDAEKAWSSLVAASEIGLRDSYNTAKVITSNIKDYFNSELTQEQQIERDFARFKYEQNYFNDAREKIMETVAPEFRDDMSVLADFLDPTNLAPSLIGTKFLNKGTRKVVKGGLGYGGQAVGRVIEGAGKVTEKALGLPAIGADKLKLKGMYRGLQGAAFMVGAGGGGIFSTVGTVVAGVGIGEALGKIAAKTGRQMAEVSRVFSQPSSHARFLHRITTDDKVSKPLRALAARLYKMRGTKMYDVGFDMLVAGIGAGSAQIAMEAAKGKSAEEIGYATGAGVAMGSPTGAIAGERGSGKSTASFDAQGNLTERSQQSIENYLVRKAEMLDKETLKAFPRLNDSSKLTLATLDELSGLGTIRMHLVSDDLFRSKTGQKAGASLPAAYNPNEKTIYLNESQLNEGVKVLPSLFLHEYGHHFLTDMIGASPLMSRVILESFEDPDGYEYFFRDADGKNLGSIKVNQEAHDFAQQYAKDIDSSIGEVAAELNEDRDAYLLAQEIGAEQFSMMMQDSPNAFEKHDKSFRHMLLGATHDALAKIGVINPRNGAEAKSAISEAMLKNKDVRKTYNNFIKERTRHYRGRADDIETGRKHSPNSGQTSDERFTQLFGGVGVNLQVAAQFHVRDSVMYDELMEALELAAESEGDYVGLGKGAEGSKLHYKVREIFGKSGQYNAAVKAIIDMIQAHIDQRKMMKFGYRSASLKNRSDYNPFFERSVTPYAWQISPKKVRNWKGRTVYPNLKVMGYDADLIMSNAERLAQAGFIDSIDDFLKAFQQRASEVLSPDGEGRINPQGLGENEMMVAALGMKESFEKIQNPKLAEWLSHPDNKLKNAFKSYDVGQLAGLSTQNKAGFAFDYRNAKHNYMPALAGQGYQNSTIKPKRGDRVAELVKRANRLRTGAMSEGEYQKAVDKFKPVEILTKADIIPATRDEMIKAIKGESRKKLVGAKVPKGTNVGIRLDINAYLYEDTWVPTIHEAGKSGREVGKVLSYDSVAVVDNATLDNKKNISLKIAAGDVPKTSYARINGKWNPKSKKAAVALAEEALANKDGSWTQVGFDPERHSYFYDREDNSLAVTSADQVVQVGRAVFAKNANKQPAMKAFGKGNFFMPAIKDWPVRAWDGNSRITISAEQALKRRDIQAVRTGEGIDDYTWKDINGNITPLESIFSKDAADKLNKLFSQPINEKAFTDQRMDRLGEALQIIAEVPRTQKTGVTISQNLAEITGLNSDGKLGVEKVDSGKHADNETFVIYTLPTDGRTYNQLLNDYVVQQIEVMVDHMEKRITVYSEDARNTSEGAVTTPSFGLIAYQSIFDYAHNNGYEYFPDTALSHRNMYRLVPAMLSSVLKNKSYDHLKIYNSMSVGHSAADRTMQRRFNERKLTVTQAIAMLAMIERRNVGDAPFGSDGPLDPSDWSFQFDDGAIISKYRSDVLGDGAILQAIKDYDSTFSFAMGISSVKRAILTDTLLDRDSDLPLIEQTANEKVFNSGALDKIFFMPAEFKAAVGVAPKRVSVVPTLDAGTAIAKEPEFQDFVQNNKQIADAFGFELLDERPVIGGWKDSETNQISREASHRLLIKSNSDADLNTFAAITGVLADEVQDSVMKVRYIKRNTKESNGREYHINIDPVIGEQITSLQFLERYGLEGGFTYDPKDEKLIFATWSPEGWTQVKRLAEAVDKLGGLRDINEASASVGFPEIKDYRSLLSPARIKRHHGGTNRAAVRDLAEQARTKLEEHDRAGTLFMPATATQRAAKEKSEMVFPTTTYVNALPKGESLSQKSEDWDEAGWNKYFEDQKLADALMKQLASNPTAQGWQDINEVRTGRISKAEFPSAPTQVLEWLNDPAKLAAFIETARQKNPKLVQLAEQGVLAAKKNYGAKKTPEVVAQSFIWGFLSRMLDPYNQEAGWLRCTASNDFWNAVYQSIDGNFTMDRGEYMTAEKMAIKNRKWEQQTGYKKLQDRKKEIGEERDAAKKLAKTKRQKDAVTAKYKKKTDAINKKIKDYIDSRYKKLTKKAKDAHQQEANDFNLNQQKGTWIDLVANMFDGQNAANANKAGQNAKQNINGAYSLLQKWNGRWNEVTDIFNSSMTGQQMREEMWKMGLEGGGIGDKVTSFVIATMADGGVVIMDRWQFVNCWINEIKEAVANRGQKVQDILNDKEASATAKKLAKQQAKEYEKYGNNPFRYSANDVPEDRSNFYDAVGSKLTPVAEHALYRTMEFYFQQMADSLQQLDPQRYGWIDSPFAVHWLLWNIAKDEAVGHSSLDILSDIIQNNTSPQNPSQRPAFVQNYQNQPSFAEKNEYLPKENINRRSRFRIKQGRPEEEITETRRFPAFGRETAVTNTYFR